MIFTLAHWLPEELLLLFTPGAEFLNAPACLRKRLSRYRAEPPDGFSRMVGRSAFSRRFAYDASAAPFPAVP